MKNLLEHIRPDKSFKNFMLICRLILTLHAPLNPFALFHICDMHELGANACAIILSRAICSVAFDIQVGDILRRKPTKRIEMCLQVSPTAKGIECFFFSYVHLVYRSTRKIVRRRYFSYW